MAEDGWGVSGPAGVTLRPGTVEDARFAATLHASAIGEGFLASLGPEFLRLLYRRVVVTEGSFLIVADAPAGTPVGFIAGAESVGQLYRTFLRRDAIKAALAAPRALARGRRRAWETLRYGRGVTAGGQNPVRDAELLAVAVSPAGRSRGTGRRLVDAFLSEVEDRGIPTAHVVVGSDNHAAIGMYESAGFVVEEEFELHPGTVSLRLRWTGPAPVATQ